MCGFDAHCGYTKYARAYRYLTENEGCLFILTNDDSTFPTGSGKLYPGERIQRLVRIMTPLGRDVGSYAQLELTTYSQ